MWDNVPHIRIEFSIIVKSGGNRLPIWGFWMEHSVQLDKQVDVSCQKAVICG